MFRDCPRFEELKDKISSELFEVNGRVSTLKQFTESLSRFLDNSDIDVNANVVQNINKKALTNIEVVNELLKNVNEDVKEIDNIEDSELGKPQIIARDKLIRDSRFSIQESQTAQQQFSKIIKSINAEARGKLNEEQNWTALLQEDEESHQTNNDNTAQRQVNFVIEREPINNEEFAYQQRLIQERDEEITNIERGITELNGIFKDLGAVITHQGMMVDNIEANIYSAVENTAGASQELNKANRMQKRSSRYCLYFLMILVVMLILMILIVI